MAKGAPESKAFKISTERQKNRDGAPISIKGAQCGEHFIRSLIEPNQSKQKNTVASAFEFSTLARNSLSLGVMV
jgi:hypothetical protein